MRRAGIGLEQLEDPVLDRQRTGTEQRRLDGPGDPAGMIGVGDHRVEIIERDGDGEFQSLPLPASLDLGGVVIEPVAGRKVAAHGFGEAHADGGCLFHATLTT